MVMGAGWVKHNKADLGVVSFKVSGWVFSFISFANKVAAYRAACFAFQTYLIVTPGIFPPRSSRSSSS